MCVGVCVCVWEGTASGGIYKHLRNPYGPNNSTMGQGNRWAPYPLYSCSNILGILMDPTIALWISGIGGHHILYIAVVIS